LIVKYEHEGSDEYNDLGLAGDIIRAYNGQELSLYPSSYVDTGTFERLWVGPYGLNNFFILIQGADASNQAQIRYDDSPETHFQQQHDGNSLTLDTQLNVNPATNVSMVDATYGLNSIGVFGNKIAFDTGVPGVGVATFTFISYGLRPTV
jgi:hypothetical protein